jgi:hypothetical protein
VSGELTDAVESGRLDAETVLRECSEPATRAFVQHSLAVAVTSTSEAKQLLLGRLIAQRLQTSTDTVDDIALQRAVDVVGLMTEHQLLLLAAHVLVRYRLYELPPVGSRDDVERLFSERFSGVIERFSQVPDWVTADFESLASVGVIRIDDHPGEQVQRIKGPDAIDDWMQHVGVSTWDGIEGQLGTSDSHERFQMRFPTIMAMKAIAANRIADMEHALVNGWRVDGVNLSPVGLRLGSTVLDQLLAV